METLSLPHEHFGSRISLGKGINKANDGAVRFGDVEICVQNKSNELFLLWLSTPQAQGFIKQRIKELKSDLEEKKNPSPIKKVHHLPRNPDNKENFHPQFTTNKENIYSPPSPTRVLSQVDKKSPPRFLDFDDGAKENRTHRKSLSTEYLQRKRTQKQKQSIPRFYFPKGQDPDSKQQFSSEMQIFKKAFLEAGGKLDFVPFVGIISDMLQLPSTVASLLFKRLDSLKRSFIVEDQLVSFWNAYMRVSNSETRVFNILKQPMSKFLTPEDFRPLLSEILGMHPGLEFLQETQEFTDRYTETVISRIFFVGCGGSKKPRMSLNEFISSNIVSVLLQLESEDDINTVMADSWLLRLQITDFFSYEHFYVIYCKFWELDSDHDLLISGEELGRYGGGGLSPQILDRIMQLPRFTTSKKIKIPEGKIGFQDFVWFILAEEDKNHPSSVEYWFQCLDIDGDGYVSLFEMEFFYKNQMIRTEDLGYESLPFLDILCQLIDMINPKDRERITLLDFKNCKQCTCVFNTLFNVNKFLSFEREPYSAENRECTNEWIRFAKYEYEMAQANER